VKTTNKEVRLNTWLIEIWIASPWVFVDHLSIQVGRYCD